MRRSCCLYVSVVGAVVDGPAHCVVAAAVVAFVVAAAAVGA